jgi:hypothetical protein
VGKLTSGKSPFSHNNGRRGRWPCQPDEAWYRKGDAPANGAIALLKPESRPHGGLFSAHVSSFQSVLVRPEWRRAPYYSRERGLPAGSPPQHRLRGLASARPPAARPAGLGPAPSRPRAPDDGPARFARRAAGQGDLLPARHDGEEPQKPRHRDHPAGARARVSRPCPHPGARADGGRVRGRPRPRGGGDRGRHATASRRVPGAGLLDQPENALGLRRACGAWLSLRLQPARLTAGARTDRRHPSYAVSSRAPKRRGSLGVARRGRGAPPRRRRRVLAATAASPALPWPRRRTGANVLPGSVFSSVRIRPGAPRGGTSELIIRAPATHCHDPQPLEEHGTSTHRAAAAGGRAAVSAPELRAGI